MSLITVAGTPLAFMGYRWTLWILVLFALAELVTDQLPATPSRTVPVQFGTRIITGALAGATLSASGHMLIVGAILGAIGAVLGTLGGAVARARLAVSFGKDLPAALLEDVVAVGGALLIVAAS